MTKDEFISGYCQRSEITAEYFQKEFVALPCGCGFEPCSGWAAVSNNPRAIKTHNDLYAPCAKEQ